MKSYVIFFAMLVLSALSACNEHNFTLEGTLKGVQDGDVYLIQSGDVEKMDTIKVVNEKFSFKGNVKEATAYMLNTGPNQQPVFFIAEKGKTKIDMEKDSPLKTTIQGGKEQTLYNEFLKHCEPTFRAMDSLGQIASNQEGNHAVLTELQNKFMVMDAELKAYQLQFVKQNKSNMISAFIGANFLNEKMDKTLEETKDVYNSLDPAVQKTYYGKKIATLVQQMSQTAIGAIAPDFSLPDLQDKIVSVKDFRGKITLIDFWASWCGPCRQENPFVVKAYQQFKDKGFAILGVSLDNGKQQWQDAIQKDKLTWQQVSDLKGWNSEVAAAYGVQSIPSNFLLDKEGKIIAKNLRGEDLVKTLKALLP